MSFPIDVSQVIRVLLPDGWHDVSENTFQVARYVLENPAVSIYPVFKSDGGFCFKDQDGRQIAGPMSSVLAVISTTGTQN